LRRKRREGGQTGKRIKGGQGGEKSNVKFQWVYTGEKCTRSRGKYLGGRGRVQGYDRKGSIRYQSRPGGNGQDKLTSRKKQNKVFKENSKKKDN